MAVLIFFMDIYFIESIVNNILLVIFYLTVNNKITETFLRGKCADIMMAFSKNINILFYFQKSY